MRPATKKAVDKSRRSAPGADKSPEGNQDLLRLEVKRDRSKYVWQPRGEIYEAKQSAKTSRLGEARYSASD